MKLLGLEFGRHEELIPDVVIPFEQAVRHDTVYDRYQKDQTRRSEELRREPGGNGENKGWNGKTDGSNSEEDVMPSTSTDYHPNSIGGLRAEIMEDVKENGHDSAYDMKSLVINRAIQDIGMGRYNWELFVLCGFGWFADNLWLQGVALTLPSLQTTFGVSEKNVRYTTCSLFIGLCIGACFWGIGSDVMGRRLAFNMTLFLAGVFGIAVGAGPTWIGTCGLFAALGTGVGGNLPVDGALFLEFLPNASGALLTVLLKLSADKGWRYFVYTMGAMAFAMFLARFLLFHLFESPKFLLSQNKQTAAVAFVHGMAKKNRTTTWLTEEILNEIGGDPAVQQTTKLSTVEVVKHKLATFSGKRFGPIFKDKKLGINTVLLWFCWLTIGMGYPLFNSFLPQYLKNGKGSDGAPVSNYETYRNYAITSVVGVPGSILAFWTVDISKFGRRGTMATSTLLSGIFLFLFTISANSSYQLAFSSIEAFFQNIMYGVLYAYTPEVFPAPVRGTGTGVASFLNRVGGLCAPIIAANIPGSNPSAPVYVAGALILAAGIAMIFLPLETATRPKL